MEFFDEKKVHSEPIKVSEINKEMEKELFYFLDKGIETPYVDFLYELVTNSNNKKSKVFYGLLEKMQSNGLGKQYFPVFYILLFSHFKKEKGFDDKINFSIGGWPIFFYTVMYKGLDTAIREFRGSHDDDEVVKPEFIGFISSLYANNGLEMIRDTHLNKKSCYITDEAIKIKEIEKALINYNSLFRYRSLKELIEKLNISKVENIKESVFDEEKIKNIAQNLVGLLNLLKKERNPYLKSIKEYIEKNFYLKNLVEYGKTGNKVFLDKFGRLELDLYLPVKGKVEIGNVYLPEKVFDEIIYFKFCDEEEYSIPIVNPYYLTIMKLNAGREKDFKDLLKLYEGLFSINEIQRRKFKLKSPEEYLRSLPNELKEKFIEYLEKNKHFINKNSFIKRIKNYLEK